MTVDIFAVRKPRDILYKEQYTEAERRLSGVGGVVCHSWLGLEEPPPHTHTFIYLFIVSQLIFYEAATSEPSRASQTSKQARAGRLDTQEGGYSTEGKSQAHFHPKSVTLIKAQGA